VVAGLLAAAAVLALLGPGFSAHLRSLTSYVLAPLGDTGMYLATSIESRVGRLGRRAVSPAEVRRLLAANEELKARLNAVEGELARLIRRRRTMRALYGAIPYAQWELIPALVVGRDSLSYGQTRLLNVGRSDGAALGAGVTTRRLLTDRSKRLPQNVATISATALVGRVMDAGRFTARLQTVTDPAFEVPAKIRRVIDPSNPRKITVTVGGAGLQVLTPANNVRIPVLARGDGRGGLIVRDVNAYHNIRPGDLLVTAGDDAFLPVQVRIGKVVEVIDDPRRRGLFVSLRVAPSANLSTLREVYIVVPATASQVDRKAPR